MGQWSRRAGNDWPQTVIAALLSCWSCAGFLLPPCSSAWGQPGGLQSKGASGEHLQTAITALLWGGVCVAAQESVEGGSVRGCLDTSPKNEA